MELHSRCDFRGGKEMVASVKNAEAGEAHVPLFPANRQQSSTLPLDPDPLDIIDKPYHIPVLKHMLKFYRFYCSPFTGP